MKNAEMKVVRFDAEDVIATSIGGNMLNKYGEYVTRGMELIQSGVSTHNDAPVGDSTFYLVQAQNSGEVTIEYESDQNDAAYAWYNNAWGLWGTQGMYAADYNGKLPTGMD